MKKKSLALILAAVLVLGLFASCAPSNPATTTAAPTPGGDTQTTQAGDSSSDEYTVTLEYEDGVSRARNQIVDAGDSMKEPAKPERTGYSFEGWSLTKEGAEKITFPYTPTGNVTLYATWGAAKYTVTFNMNYEGGTNIENQVEFEGEVSAPEAPVREGYTFYKWAMDAAGENDAAFPYTVKNDVSFYAVWAEGSLTIVSFDLNYEGAENTMENITLAEGEKVTKKMVTDPERANYKFKGWSETEDGALVKFPYTPKSSVKLYAIWERDSYSVAFRDEYAKSPVFANTKVDAGDSVDAPETEPTRENYIFEGWFNAQDGGEKVEFPFTPMTKSTALYAHWKHVPVETTTFQAEYVYIDASEKFPGYSGEATGIGIISPQTTETGLITTDGQTSGYYCTYLYKRGAALKFEIEASQAGTATLVVNLAIEMKANWTFTSAEGENCYKVKVNEKEVNYGVFAFNDSAA
ncbi:MAG: InlB B-repeat-containing protein, partial [Lachnospiraceae bacterium]|nr:InlB B-repeat-containing protein [Lachnospiraceae bacterium]